MFRQSWSLRSGEHQYFAGLFVMSMAVTGVAITIATDSIAFLASGGTVANIRPRKGFQIALDGKVEFAAHLAIGKAQRMESGAPGFAAMPRN
jgi:hypothetical protein